MNKCWLVLCMWGLMLLVSCSVDAPPASVPVNRETALALTPQATATLAPTRTSVPTAAATITPTPTLEPTAAPEETATTRALVDVSYCTRSFGPANGARFSARLDRVRTDQTDDFEQITFVFADTSGALHGSASCMLAAAWPADADLGASAAPGAGIIAVSLDDWAHDDLFAASPLTETVEITPSDVLEQVSFAAASLDSRGALLGIGLREPRPFRVRVQGDELIVEVARDEIFPPDDDPLGLTAGDAPAVEQPVFFLQAGDVFRLQGGRAQAVARTPELETGLAVSADGTLLAVCRAPADAEPFALPYGVRATLWTMRPDGSGQQQLADVGGCAEPAFAMSGKTIAFTANVAPSPPAVLQVWTVPTVGGEASSVAPADEWSRSLPHWFADGRLVYRASNGSQTIIFVRGVDGREQEVTAQMLTDVTYDGVGQFVVDPANGQLAIEALRTADDGADLVVLRADGSSVAVEQRGFWQRPLAFTPDGLVYLTTECPSESVLRYTVHRRPPRGSIETMFSGQTADGIGAATTQGDTLLYVRSTSDAPGVRGPSVEPGLADESSIWAISVDGTARAQLYTSDSGITQLQSRGP